MQQADISKVRASVHQQCGSKVMIQLDRGRNKVDIQQGVIQHAAMFMRKKNAVTVLQNSIAVADVQQTPTISMEISTMHTTSDVHFRKSVLNARS